MLYCRWLEQAYYEINGVTVRKEVCGFVSECVCVCVSVMRAVECLVKEPIFLRTTFLLPFTHIKKHTHAIAMTTEGPTHSIMAQGNNKNNNKSIV